MKYRYALVALTATFVVALAGCGQTREESTAHAEQPSADANANATAPSGTTPDANGTANGANAAPGTLDRSPSPSDLNPGAAPDNTGVNKRDRNDANPTADDQSHSPADLDLSRRIRDAVTDDDSLSANGKNVKIIARDGKVTLRGPVKDAAEKKAIGDKAAVIAGAGNVDNQLEPVR